MHPLGTKVYLLKRYSPSDSFCTFFFLRVYPLPLKCLIAHQDCIFLLLKNTVLWNIWVLYCNYNLKCHLFMWCKAEFSTSVLRAPLEIILTCWFSDHETVFIMLKTTYVCVSLDKLCVHAHVFVFWMTHDETQISQMFILTGLWTD